MFEIVYSFTFGFHTGITMEISKQGFIKVSGPSWSILNECYELSTKLKYVDNTEQIILSRFAKNVQIERTCGETNGYASAECLFG